MRDCHAYNLSGLIHIATSPSDAPGCHNRGFLVKFLYHHANVSMSQEPEDTKPKLNLNISYDGTS
jgi:hypothetical protein